MSVDWNNQNAALIQAVQRNCDISDALHAREFSLCTYLLKMREYYRWQQTLSFSDTPDKEKIGDFVANRESWWDSIEEETFRVLPLDGKTVTPFDAEIINDQLRDQHKVYSAGIGLFGQPHFMLADLNHVENTGTTKIHVCGREFARDITAPPAMRIGDDIFIRLQSLKRYTWELYEEWQWHRNEGPMSRLAAAYHLTPVNLTSSSNKVGECSLDESLNQLVLAHYHILVDHERGESMVGQTLDPKWHELLQCVLSTPAEVQLRAVRDLIADCEVTLPNIVSAQDTLSLDFYLAGFRGMRRSLFPAMLQAAHMEEPEARLTHTRHLLRLGKRHWWAVAKRLLNVDTQNDLVAKDQILAIMAESACPVS